MKRGQTSAIHFFGQVVTSIAGFAVNLYVARVLGASVLGTYALVISVIAWATLPSQLGINHAVKKRLSEATDRYSVLSTGMLMQALLVSVVSLILLLFSEEINEYLGAPVVDILVVMLFVSLSVQFVNSALDGQKKVHLSSFLPPIWWGGRAVFQIGLAIAGFGLVGLLWGYVIGGTLALAAGLYFLSIKFVRPTKESFDSIVSFAKYSWLAPIKNRSFLSMDTIVLGVFVANELIGVYEIAWNIASLFAIFGASISATLFPEISSLSAKGRDDQVRDAISASFSYAGLFLIPGLVGSVLVGDKILSIYGPEFPIGYEVLLILVFARLFYAFEMQITNALDAINHPEQTYKVNIFFVCFNFILNIVLISQHGWYGAAIATALSATVSTGISYWLLQRYLSVQIPALELTRQTLAAGVMGIVVLVGRETVGSSLVVVFVLVFIGAGTYFATLWAISAQFRKTVRDNLPSVNVGA
ncbi:flippase [Haloferax namakaokahaiae]|uniref:Flippase n=1 Tax=Haloferax namakaokahaiae TaxID=1748331 RepID=A0ABD5ZE75_9EURY